MKGTRWFAAAALAAALGAGCAHQAVRGSREASDSDAAAKAAADAAAKAAAEAAKPEPDVRGDSMQRVTELKDVYFDFDSASLTEEARGILAANATWLKEHDELAAQVSGNCDQRGSVEYNLALGQRRAYAVRQYYIHSGVPASRVATISYGKERLACRRESEDCWRENRRAETRVASPGAARR